jgi:hypothetical protein
MPCWISSSGESSDGSSSGVASALSSVAVVDSFTVYHLSSGATPAILLYVAGSVRPTLEEPHHHDACGEGVSRAASTIRYLLVHRCAYTARSASGVGVRTQARQGWCFSDDSTGAGAPISQSPSYATHDARLKLCNPGVRSHCPFAPRAGFSPDSDQRSKARQVDSLQIGTCSSKRPFALLKRLPATGPPFQSQCSWPISSARHQVFPGLVRSDRSSTLSG